MHRFYATTTKGTEGLLASELRDCDAQNITPGHGGVEFAGELRTAYRACLWSRVASRILLPLARFPAQNAAALYSGVRSIRWIDHLDARRTLAVEAVGTSPALGHSHYVALKTKDAIVDQIREKTGERPSIDLARPDIRVHVYLHGGHASVSLDLSGEAMHRRGYRVEGGSAPLKENLAAALLLFADWPQRAREGAPFLDPLCGSGTLPLEAAMIAANIAPARWRSHFGFLAWRQHDAPLWRELCREAEDVEIRDRRRLPSIRGSDSNAHAVRTALANVEKSGLRGLVHIERQALGDCAPLPKRSFASGGVLVTNPPYGERLKDSHLEVLYATLGDVLRRRFLGWNAYVLTGNLDLGRKIGLRPQRRFPLWNGPIECRLLSFPIAESPVQGDGMPRWRTEQVSQSTSKDEGNERVVAPATRPTGRKPIRQRPV